MERRNKVTVTRGEARRKILGERRASQGTCIKDPGYWTTGWRLREREHGGGGQGRAMGEKLGQL